MIQFLSPLGLLSLLALAVPIFIHLLSRKPGKIIKVGSLQFLSPSASARFQSLKPSEPFLLLVRMAIIASLALLLAQPVWVNKISAPDSAAKGWILIAPPLLPASPPAGIFSRLDSLAAAGHELRVLAPGFPAVSAGDSPPETAGPNYWSLLREADHLLPGQMPVWVFATDRSSAFQGERPALSREFHWQTWRDSRALPGNGGAARPAASKDTLHVALPHSSEREAEAVYLEAALTIAAEACGRPIRFDHAENHEQSWRSFDFVFWLREDSLPQALTQNLERGSILITTAKAQAYESCESLIVTPHAAESSFPRLWRRSAPSHNGAPLWRDGFGAPLLEAERRGLGWHYRFASRFDPAWNELALHPALPEWMFSLLSRLDVFDAVLQRRHDDGRISAAQAVPQKKSPAAARLEPSAQRLHAPLWLLAALLFGVERWMSDRRKS